MENNISKDNDDPASLFQHAALFVIVKYPIIIHSRQIALYSARDYYTG